MTMLMTLYIENTLVSKKTSQKIYEISMNKKKNFGNSMSMPFNVDNGDL